MRWRKTFKIWWGRLEKRQVATESGGDETGDETGGPGDETGDKMTAGDERDGGDRWGNVYELLLHYVAGTTFLHRSSYDQNSHKMFQRKL